MTAFTRADARSPRCECKRGTARRALPSSNFSDPLVRADVLLGQNLRACSASKLIFLQTSATWPGSRLHACPTTDKLSSLSSRTGESLLASE